MRYADSGRCGICLSNEAVVDALANRAISGRVHDMLVILKDVVVVERIEASSNLSKVGILLSVGRERVVVGDATSKCTALVAPAFPGKQSLGGEEALVVGAGLEVAVAVISAVDLDGVSQSVSLTVDEVNTFSSARRQLGGLLRGIDRRGNGVRSGKLIQRDSTEREVLRDEGDRKRGCREERGKNGELVEDHVGQ